MSIKLKDFMEVHRECHCRHASDAGEVNVG